MAEEKTVTFEDLLNNRMKEAMSDDPEVRKAAMSDLNILLKNDIERRKTQTDILIQKERTKSDLITEIVKVVGGGLMVGLMYAGYRGFSEAGGVDIMADKIYHGFASWGIRKM